eukprot:390443-Heterocapsa_arctica.AAC.1
MPRGLTARGSEGTRARRAASALDMASEAAGDQDRQEPGGREGRVLEAGRQPQADLEVHRDAVRLRGVREDEVLHVT